MADKLKYLKWHRDDSHRTRRANLLRSKNGDLMQAYRTMIELSRTSNDAETRRLAKADAVNFLSKYKTKQKIKGKLKGKKDKK